MTVDEPSALVVSNVSWHISTGAQEVHVYFDRPSDPVMPMVSAIPQVKVVECNDAYWSNYRSGRPHAQTKRQFHNANHALKECSVDWLVHIDADEFLYQIHPIQQELMIIQNMNVALHFDVRERVYVRSSSASNIFDGAFRSRSLLPAVLDRNIYGDLNRYLQRGLLSHCAGKTAVPTGQDFILGVHGAYRGNRSPDARVVPYQSKSAALLHFDGLTPLHWIAKLIRYSKVMQDLGTSMFSKPRRCQIEECQKNIGSDRALVALHDKLRLLTEEQKLLHMNYGLLHDERFDPSFAVQSITSKAADLSLRSFDLELLARDPEIPPALDALCGKAVDY